MSLLTKLEQYIPGRPSSGQYEKNIWGQVIGGAAQIASGLIGGRQRRREQQAAQAQFDADQQALRNFNFENTYANLENTAEDLTVNQQATNVQAQQTDQALAQGLDAIVASGGGGGSAQAIANAALQSKQNISADLASQEQANQQARAAQAAQLQADEAAGADHLQTRQYQQTQQGLNLSAGRLSQANQAREKALGRVLGGVGSIVGGVAGSGAGDAANAAAAGGGSGVGAALGKAASFVGGLFSDPALKRNIKKVGTSPRGIGIYQFQYHNDPATYKGTLSTELNLPKDAVGERNGYATLDYSNPNVDVAFEMIDDGKSKKK